MKIQRTLQSYYVFIYQNEEQVLSDVIYQFKHARDFTQDIRNALLADLNFNSVLDMTTMTPNEMKKL